MNRLHVLFPTLVVLGLLGGCLGGLFVCVLGLSLGHICTNSTVCCQWLNVFASLVEMRQREKTKTGMKEVVNGSEDFVLD